jgi:hypothetical protein
MQMLNAQQITLEQLLEAGSFPFADKLLQSVQTQKQEMANAQMMQQPMVQQ